jgi:hypothetical protein
MPDTKQSESRREVADRIAKDFADFPSEWGRKLSAAIEAALKDRDERAAKIVDERAAFNARQRDEYTQRHEHKFADLKDTRRDESEIIAREIRGNEADETEAGLLRHAREIAEAIRKDADD